LLFNPVADVELQQTNAVFSWIWSEIKMDHYWYERLALNKEWSVLFSSTTERASSL
jgi:hypothetical protein